MTTINGAVTVVRIEQPVSRNANRDSSGEQNMFFKKPSEIPGILVKGASKPVKKITQAVKNKINRELLKKQLKLNEQAIEDTLNT